MEKIDHSAAAFAVCMGMDALRICIGVKPKNFTAREVLRWMRIQVEGEA